jgi:hypothetical protein
MRFSAISLGTWRRFSAASRLATLAVLNQAIKIIKRHNSLYSGYILGQYLALNERLRGEVLRKRGARKEEIEYY